ncbi:uncharacterized protein CEXT_607791 [Caerostris extrusa]|uniref:Uncharacterized protein n=1 Tax=Caerostris extrusa TaxID=172846 RepID=A0AAV4MVS2_CAEEX|nr:uncharacterized protein CEXT_607791 [Caerostris extrusa]
MHDDPKKNRVFTTQDHSLVIRRVRPHDGAYYFCYDVEDKVEAQRLIFYLTKNNSLMCSMRTKKPYNVKLHLLFYFSHPTKCLRSSSIKNARRFQQRNSQMVETVSEHKKIQIFVKIQVLCGMGTLEQMRRVRQSGPKKRIGECRLQKFVKAQMETEGKTVKADFPVVGVGCHSVLLDVIPVAKKILYKIPNLVMIEKCEVSCTVKDESFHEKFFLEEAVSENKEKLKSVSPTISAETKQGPRRNLPHSLLSRGKHRYSSEVEVQRKNNESR